MSNWEAMQSREAPSALVANTHVGLCRVATNVRKNNGDMSIAITTARGKRLRIMVDGYSGTVSAITRSDTDKDARKALVTMGAITS